jgi:hypothetical protein
MAYKSSVRRDTLIVLFSLFGTGVPLLAGCASDEESDSVEQSKATGGTSGKVSDPVSSDPATAWKSLQATPLTVVSTGIYGEGDAPDARLSDFAIEPGPSVCTDEWIDFGCDGAFYPAPLEDACTDSLRMDFSEGSSCPVCVAPPETEPTCGEAQRHYLEFLDHNLRETCTNWCETDDDCAASEVEACGLTYAMALRALVDEEPLGFAVSFARDNCGACVDDGEDPAIASSAKLLEFTETACQQNQCVLVAADQPSGMGGGVSR